MLLLLALLVADAPIVVAPGAHPAAPGRVGRRRLLRRLHQGRQHRVLGVGRQREDLVRADRRDRRARQGGRRHAARAADRGRREEDDLRHRAALLRRGGVLASNTPPSDLYLAVSTDGGKTFSKPVQINDAPKQAPESLHWLAAAPNGDVSSPGSTCATRDPPGQDLAYVKISDQGRKVGKNVVLPGPLCECCAPGLTVDAKGTPDPVYREGGKATGRSI